MATMTIEQLTAKIKNDLNKKRTKEESLDILIKSDILTKNGNFNRKYFSNETINRDKKKRQR